MKRLLRVVDGVTEVLARLWPLSRTPDDVIARDRARHGDVPDTTRDWSCPAHALTG